MIDCFHDMAFLTTAWCLHHLLEPDSSTSQMTLRTRGHSFNLLRFHFDLTKKSFIFRSLYGFSLYVEVGLFVENACVCIRLRTLKNNSTVGPIKGLGVNVKVTNSANVLTDTNPYS